MRHAGPIHAAQYSPDGRWIVTASGDGSARIWDAGTGEPVTAPWRHEGSVETAEFDRNGTTVATAGTATQTVRLWDVSLAPRSGSFAYLADLFEAAIGARLTEQGSVVPSRRTLEESPTDVELAASFPAQFAALLARRNRPQR